MSVIDGTELNFQAIINHSQKVPIILDLYADWCAPCKKLTPDLVARAQKANGRVLLVKINTEKEERLAGYLRVQHLPTVVGLFQGKQLGNFVGAPTPQELDDFFSKVLAAAGTDSEEDSLLERARLCYEESNIPGASQLFSQLLGSPNASEVAKVSAMSGLIHCALFEKNYGAAQSLVAHLKQSFSALVADHIQAQQAIAATELAVSTTSKAGGKSAEELKQQLSADPDNLQLLHELALCYLAQTNFEEGLATCLQALKIDRSNQEIKNLLFKSLDTLGNDHPLVPVTRRRLSNILFT